MGTNRYAYSFNDPVNLSDPNGNVVTSCKNGSENCEEIDDLKFNETLPQDVIDLENQAIKILYGPDATLETLIEMEYFHSYATQRTICNEYCNIGLANSIIGKAAAPNSGWYGGPLKDAPIENGDHSIASGGPAIVGGVPLPGGEVEHLASPNSGAVANITVDGHQLHPGYILRWVEQDSSGAIIIRTLGRGTYNYPRVNTYLGTRIFDDQDQMIQRIYIYQDTQ